MTVFATGRGRMSGRLLMAPGRAILFGLYPSSCTVRCRYAALAIPRIAKEHLVNVGRSGLGNRTRVFRTGTWPQLRPLAPAAV